MTPGRPDQDELLTTAGMPRWVRWAGGLGAAALVVGLVVVKAASDRSDGSTSSAPLALTSRQSLPASPLPAAHAEHVPLPDAFTPLYDVVTDANTTWVLSDYALLWRTTGSWHAVLLGHPVSSGRGQPTLVLDSDAHRLWLVVLGTARSTVTAFDTVARRWGASVPWSRAIVAAAPLHGSLYVADSSGLSRLTADAAAPSRVELPGRPRILDLAADPRHGRALVLVESGSGSLISAIGVSGAAVSSAAPAGLVNGWLGVTGSGQIWLAGFGRSGAVLVRLDPTSLRTENVSPLASRLGPGALLLASGSGSLLIGDGGVAELWCVDDQAGAPIQRWPIAALRAGSGPGLAFAVVSTGLVRLQLEGRCVG